MKFTGICREIEIESGRVICSTIATPGEVSNPSPTKKEAKPQGSVHSSMERWRDLPFFERSKLASRAHFAGPALVFEQHSGTVIEGGWQAKVDAAGALLLKYMN